MRILAQPTIDSSKVSKAVQSAPTEHEAKQGSYDSTSMIIQQILPNENNEISEEKLQQAVKSMNELLEINHNSSKFVYHEGLERYYVTVVDKDTDKVIKEIPPKKLLDAFYEMQKLVGMIVDEKI
ncbi:flagellar protein FlaG [Lysinibacillus telephonicus]|uniref:flagellar protein FlaG n=1 Tax=Lysinibacillus telephonicus TaxID=1714840 RepID=UPI0031FCBA85